MNADFDSILIRQERMAAFRGLALERAMPVSDIVQEALDEYLLARTGGVPFLDMFRSMENAMRSAAQFVTSADPTGLILCVKSPIRYVYRPELKYEVRVTRNDGTSLGKFSVILRSRDMDILKRFSGFVSLWVALEREYLPKNRAGQMAYATDTGYFSRQIYYPAAAGHSDGQAIGAAISSYICVFDELFKVYFRQQDDGYGIEKLYLARRKDGNLTI